MKSQNALPYVLIVDRQKYWREMAARALSEAAYLVRLQDDYKNSVAASSPNGRLPDLVILGCASITPEEREFMEKILFDKHPLLVLSACLHRNDMRSLFLQEITDVTDKAYEPQTLVNIVNHTFSNLKKRSLLNHSEKPEERNHE